MRRPVLVRVNEFILMRSARSESKMIRAFIFIFLTSSTLARSTEQLNRRDQLHHALQEAYHVDEGSGVNADRTARSLNDRPQERALSSQEIFNDESGSDGEKTETLQRVPKCSLYFCPKSGICDGQGSDSRGSARLANDGSLHIQERELATLVKILNAIGPKSGGRMSEAEAHRMRQHLMNLGRFSDEEPNRPFTRSEVAAMITKLHEMSRTSNQEVVKDKPLLHETMPREREELKNTPAVTHEELKSMVDKLHTMIFKNNGTEKTDDAEKHMMNELSQQLTKLMESKELMDKLRSKRQAVGLAGNGGAVGIVEHEVVKEKTTMRQTDDSDTTLQTAAPGPLASLGVHSVLDNGVVNEVSELYCKAEAVAHGHSHPIELSIHQIACELKILVKILDTTIMNLKDELTVFIHLKFGDDKSLLDNPVEIFLHVIDVLTSEPERIATLFDLVKESIPLADISLVVNRIKDAGKTILRAIHSVLSELKGGKYSTLLESVRGRLSHLLGESDDDSDSSKTSLSDKMESLREMVKGVSTAMNCYTASGLPQLIKSSHMAEMVTKVRTRVREYVANRPTLPLDPPEIPETPADEVEPKVTTTSTSVAETKCVESTDDVTIEQLHQKHTRPLYPIVPRVEKETVNIVEKDYTYKRPRRPRPHLRKFTRTEEEESTVETPDPSPPVNPTPVITPDVNLFTNAVPDVPVSPPLTPPDENDLLSPKHHKLLSKIMSRVDSIITRTAATDGLPSGLLKPWLPTITAYENDPLVPDDAPAPIEDDSPAVTTTTHTVKTTEVGSDAVPEVSEPDVISRTTSSTDTITSNEPVDNPIISERVHVHTHVLPTMSKTITKVSKTTLSTPLSPDPSELGETALIDDVLVPPSTPVHDEAPPATSVTETRKSTTVSEVAPENEAVITEEGTPIRPSINPMTITKTTSATETIDSSPPVESPSISESEDIPLQTPISVPSMLPPVVSISSTVDKTSVADDPSIIPTIEAIQTKTATTTSTTMHDAEPADPPSIQDNEDELPGRIPNALTTIPTRLRNTMSRIATTISSVVPPPSSETPIITEVQDLPPEPQPLPSPPILPHLRDVLSRIPHNYDRSPLPTEITETKTIVKSKEIAPDDTPVVPRLPHLHRYRGYDVSIHEREYPGHVRSYPNLPPYDPNLNPAVEPPVDPLSLAVVPYDRPSSAPWPSALGRCIMSGRVKPPFALPRDKVAATIGRNLLRPGDIVVIRLNDKMSVYGMVLDDVRPITFNILRPGGAMSLVRSARTIWNLIADDFPDPECDTLLSNAQLADEI